MGTSGARFKGSSVQSVRRHKSTSLSNLAVVVNFMAPIQSRPFKPLNFLHNFVSGPNLDHQWYPYQYLIITQYESIGIYIYIIYIYICIIYSYEIIWIKDIICQMAIDGYRLSLHLFYRSLRLPLGSRVAQHTTQEDPGPSMAGWSGWSNHIHIPKKTWHEEIYEHLWTSMNIYETLKDVAKFFHLSSSFRSCSVRSVLRVALIAVVTADLLGRRLSCGEPTCWPGLMW